MTEFALKNAWLIPALPLIAALLIGALGRSIKPMAHVPAWLAMIGSLVMSLAIVFAFQNDPEGTRATLDMMPALWTWFSAGSFKIEVNLHIDQLTAIYLSFVTGVGTLIFIYAAGYMKGDYGYWRFFSYFSIFVFFMCCLVMGGNFILLYFGWEGVGLASYLLIGYYYPRPSAVAAAKKAFITNRIGDFGLAIGIFLIWKYFGTVDFVSFFSQANAHHWTHLSSDQQWALYWIPFCLMLGAFGKSAQFPLHVWLPDAMEGPTPVSALIHAATMVTAGVYLIARCMPAFTAIPEGIAGYHHALNAVAIVGGFTAFLSASIALCTYDLKRVWAYSTLSQLGYMFLGLGVLATQSAVFHVFTHAWFKALLFLSAGSVMHAMGGELDLRRMSGLKRAMPITRITMLIGCLALAGVPFLSGFFSKDEIIHHAFDAHSTVGTTLGILAFAVALMTAYYTFRLYFRVFEGPLVLPATAGHHEPSPFAIEEDHGHGAAHGVDTLHANQGHAEASHGEDAHPHDHGAHGPNDGSATMWLPLLILSVGAIAAGYLGTKLTGDFIHQYLGKVNFGGHAAHGGSDPMPYMIASSIIAIVGIGIAWYFHLKNRHAAVIVGATFRPLVKFLENRWYIDHLYWTFITMGAWIGATILAFIDTWIVDLAVNIVGGIPSVVGQLLKPTQRGLLQRYALGMVAGVTAVILGVLYLMNR